MIFGYIALFIRLPTQAEAHWGNKNRNTIWRIYGEANLNYYPSGAFNRG